MMMDKVRWLDRVDLQGFKNIFSTYHMMVGFVVLHATPCTKLPELLGNMSSLLTFRKSGMNVASARMLFEAVYTSVNI